MKTIKQEVLEEFIKSDWKKWERELGKIGTLPKKRFFDREQENWKEAVDFIVDCTIKKLTEQHEKEKKELEKRIIKGIDKQIKLLLKKYQNLPAKKQLELLRTGILNNMTVDDVIETIEATNSAQTKPSTLFKPKK